MQKVVIIEEYDIEESNLDGVVEVSVVRNNMLAICFVIISSITLIVVLTFYVLFTFS